MCIQATKIHIIIPIKLTKIGRVCAKNQIRVQPSRRLARFDRIQAFACCVYHFVGFAHSPRSNFRLTASIHGISSFHGNVL